MKPRWRVFLSSSFSFSTVGALAVLLVYLESFLIYSVYQNGSAFLLLSGWAGVWAFLGTLPWLPIGLGVCAAVGLGALMHQRTRAYRLPFAYTTGITIALIIGGSSLVAATTLHPAIAGYVEAHDTPVLQPFYNTLPKSDTSQTVVGEVQDVTAESFTLQNRQGHTLHVQVPTRNAGENPATNVKKGDVVVVIEKAKGRSPKTNKATDADDRDDDPAAEDEEDAVESEHVHILPEKYQKGVRHDIDEKREAERRKVEERDEERKAQDAAEREDDRE